MSFSRGPAYTKGARSHQHEEVCSADVIQWELKYTSAFLRALFKFKASVQVFSAPPPPFQQFLTYWT